MSEENVSSLKNDNKDRETDSASVQESLGSIANNTKKDGHKLAVTGLLIGVYTLIKLVLSLTGDAYSSYFFAKFLIYIGVVFAGVAYLLAYKSKSKDGIQKIALILCSTMLLATWIAPEPININPGNVKNSSQKTLFGNYKAVNLDVGDWIEIDEWGSILRITLEGVEKLDDGQEVARFSINSAGGKSDHGIKREYFKAVDSTDLWHDLSKPSSGTKIEKNFNFTGASSGLTLNYKSQKSSKASEHYNEIVFALPEDTQQVLINKDGAFDWVWGSWNIPKQ